MSGARPISRQRSPWTYDSGDPHGVGELYLRQVGDGQLTAIVAEEPMGWHLSISFVDHKGKLSRYPRWDEITHARYELLPDDIDVVMHLPPPSEYVALHDTTFHLHEHPNDTSRGTSR